MEKIAVKAAAVVLAGALATLGSEAHAGDVAASELAQAAPAEKPAEAPPSWWDTFKISGHLEAGLTGNPDDPSGHRNFGRLFDDHDNQPVLNQLMVTLERPLDPKATGYDVGFRFQAMYGSDERFTHYFAQFDHAIDATEQIGIVEANASVHVPNLGSGGIDVKIGQFVSPMSAESIDASQNALYSHSYIFNFGVPFVHTGLLATAHVTPLLDLYLGLDTGVNAWLGGGGLANDTVAHGQAGFGLNLLDGNLTVLGLTHIGPENPKGTFGPAADSALRYLNDITIVWKAQERLTLTTDLNYIHDDGLKASGGGAAQYVAYTIDDVFTVIGRGEVWRDGNGAFVASFQRPFDYINSERGLPTSPGGVTGGGSTTYGALTFGVNIKPPVPKAIEGFVIRPEVRFDDALNGTKPFNGGKSGHQATLAADFILPF